MGSVVRNIFGNAGENSAPRETKLTAPPSIRKLNNSLFEFYKPSEGDVALDILFFHGLELSEDYNDAYWTTWMPKGRTDDTWPRAFLGQEFPQARILSVSYDGSIEVTTVGGRSDMHNIGEGLFRDIVESSQSGVGQDRPVILVSHCVGGLVIKKLILTARRHLHRYDKKKFEKEIARIEKFLQNLKGIFYYSPPNEGSRLVSLIVSKKTQTAGPVLKALEVLTNETQRVNQAFREWRETSGVKASTVYELLPTTIWGIEEIFVDEASAISDSDKYIPCNEDHIYVCRPESKISGNYSPLTDFIAGVISPKVLERAKESQAEILQ